MGLCLTAPIQQLAASDDPDALIKYVAVAEDLVNGLAKVANFEQTCVPCAGLDLDVMDQMAKVGRLRGAFLKKDLLHPKIKQITDVVFSTMSR